MEKMCLILFDLGGSFLYSRDINLIRKMKKLPFGLLYSYSFNVKQPKLRLGTHIDHNIDISILVICGMRTTTLYLL